MSSQTHLHDYFYKALDNITVALTSAGLLLIVDGVAKIIALALSLVYLGVGINKFTISRLEKKKLEKELKILENENKD